MAIFLQFCSQALSLWHTRTDEWPDAAKNHSHPRPSLTHKDLFLRDDQKNSCTTGHQGSTTSILNSIHPLLLVSPKRLSANGVAQGSCVLFHVMYHVSSSCCNFHTNITVSIASVTIGITLTIGFILHTYIQQLVVSQRSDKKDSTTGHQGCVLSIYQAVFVHPPKLLYIAAM